MQSIHHRRNLPKTYETKRNRIGDEKREIRKKKTLRWVEPPRRPTSLTRASAKPALSRRRGRCLSPARWLSLSPKKTMKSEKKKRKEKERENYLSPARRQAGSLPPASPLPPAGEPPLSRRGEMSLSLSLDGENNEREKKKKERTRERERGDSEEKAISSGYGHGAEIEIRQRRETSLWLPRDLIQTKSCTHRSADPMVRKTSNMRGRNLMTDI